jgi:hypothetical protein
MVKKMVVVPFEMVRHLLEPTAEWNVQRKMEEDTQNKSLNLRFKDDFGSQREPAEPTPLVQPSSTTSNSEQPISSRVSLTPTQSVKDEEYKTPELIINTQSQVIPETPRRPIVKDPFDRLKADLRQAKVINRRGVVIDSFGVGIKNTNINTILDYAQSPTGSSPAGANQVGRFIVDSAKTYDGISDRFLNKYKGTPTTRRPRVKVEKQKGKGLTWRTYWKGF